jgi:hypothetical protein
MDTELSWAVEQYSERRKESDTPVKYSGRVYGRENIRNVLQQGWDDMKREMHKGVDSDLPIVIVDDEYIRKHRAGLEEIKVLRKIKKVQKRFQCSYDQAIEMIEQHKKGNRIFRNDTKKPRYEEEDENKDSKCEEADMKWSQSYAVVPCTKKPSKVHFPSQDADLIQVHHMTDTDACLAARKGPWQQYARDRVRFQRRIAEVEKSINHVLVDHILKTKE